MEIHMSVQHQPNTAPTTTVSVIGLGQMGTRLAQAFLAAGHATTVWNRTPRRPTHWPPRARSAPPPWRPR